VNLYTLDTNKLQLKTLCRAEIEKGLLFTGFPYLFWHGQQCVHRDTIMVMAEPYKIKRKMPHGEAL
jgi:hypothetical protein